MELEEENDVLARKLMSELWRRLVGDTVTAAVVVEVEEENCSVVSSKVILSVSVAVSS